MCARRIKQQPSKALPIQPKDTIDLLYTRSQMRNRTSQGASRTKRTIYKVEPNNHAQYTLVHNKYWSLLQIYIEWMVLVRKYRKRLFAAFDFIYI